MKFPYLTYSKNFDIQPKEAGKNNLLNNTSLFIFKDYALKSDVGLSWFNVKKQQLYKKIIRYTSAFRNYATEAMDLVIIG